jgi:hypothetical protein
MKGDVARIVIAMRRTVIATVVARLFTGGALPQTL